MNKQWKSCTIRATIHERYKAWPDEQYCIYFIDRLHFPLTNCDGDKLSRRRKSTTCYCITFILVLLINHASAFLSHTQKRSNGDAISSPQVQSFRGSSNYWIIQQYVNGLTQSSDVSSKETATRTTNSLQQSTSKRQKRNGLLSPWHISYRKRPDDEGFRLTQTIVSRRRSLDFALLLIKKALMKISKVGHETRDSELINILNENSKLYNRMKILRVEVPISSSALIDPLAWLTAQEEYLLKVQNLNYKPNKKSHSMFYLNTHEKSMEVAAIGSALQWNETNQLWNTISDVLPSKSYVYGGSRFDHHSTTKQKANNDQERTVSKEWEAFGHAFWMLPMIELRQKLIPETSSTLAIHLVCPNNGTQWSDAAVFTSENLIQYISSAQASRIAPTTLPPILSRSTSQRNTPMDGQELYENAFEAARIEFSKGSNSSDSSNNHLKKVVLARQQTLQFGTSFRSSLDIIRRWKYGGHEGGHLFWLKPPQSTPAFANSVSYEFLGCTPERLFQIIPQSGYQMKTIVRSEALAGTRPRGSTQVEDEMLLQDLWTSPKDRLENRLTAEYIQSAFDELYQQNLIKEPRGAIWKEPTAVQAIEAKEMEASKPRSPEVSNTTPMSSRQLPLLASQAPSMWSQGFFVRRLLHLQHICQSYTAELVHDGRNNNEDSVELSTSLRAAKFLMSKLHPTPAVCGVPTTRALKFIEEYESIGFDRGFYAGPIGYIGREEADIFVAIRSGLAITSEKDIDSPNDRSRKSMTSHFRSELSVYAGGGILQDSKLRDEWAETNYKFAVIASLFPQSPVTLRSATTPNVAWATAFIEELIRNGITRFYVCPGSRSTPLVVAISRATRANSAGGSRGGTVQAISVLDERSAAFRALGYARGTGQPAAVVTSSGTAVANLYPAVIEAGMEGIPMLLLTADRPYESRDSGANQAIDQVKLFSSSYVRWFRDVLPPTDDVPVNLALSDASHAVSISRERQGPVHLNLQFRENLAPESGKIRNDERIDSITKFNGMRFTDVPGFQQWSTTGNRWFKAYRQYGSLTSFPVDSNNLLSSSAVLDVVNLIKQSRRGIIVVGNLRLPSDESLHVDQSSASQTISDFAELIGFPIFAGVQSGNLRFISPSVVPFAESLLKCPVIIQNIAPDLIIQIGAPLVSTGVAEMISSSMKLNLKNEYDAINPRDFSGQCHHVLIHPHSQHERSDPSFTVTHRVSSEIIPFLAAVSNTVSQLVVDNESVYSEQIGSELSPIIQLGRKLQAEMKSIIDEAAKIAFSSSDHLQHGANSLTEPQIIVGMSEVLDHATTDFSLFLSNSMPVRDAEFFLYPYSSTEGNKVTRLRGVGVNRGASGIDGIISSALGYCEAMQSPTTLLIGDVAALHDIGSLHSVVNTAISSNQVTTKKRHPLATIIVNNDGGGIFSFLPIAQFGNDVGFDEFFGTPTNSFSFQTGAKAFGLPVEIAKDYETFVTRYREIVRSNKDTILEAVVASRTVNVAVHKHITNLVQAFVNNQLNCVDSQNIVSERIPVKLYSKQRYSDHTAGQNQKRVALLLHGWMGDKSEWDSAASNLIEKLDPDWILLAVDLPGHGGSMRQQSQDVNVLRNALKINDEKSSEFEQNNLNLNTMAEVVLTSLSKHHHITQIDAIAGYSLGGRVALAMKQLGSQSESSDISSMISSNTALILLGTNPGDLSSLMLTKAHDESFIQDNFRSAKDDMLAMRIENICDRLNTFAAADESVSLWNPFLESWYSSPIWGSLKEKTHLYNKMVAKRARTLTQRGRDLAAVLSQCSPAQNNQFNWECCSPDKTLYVAGKLDPKYSALGTVLKNRLDWRTELVNGAGHALLVEAPGDISDLIADFLCTECSEADSAKDKNKIEKGEQIEAVDITPPLKYNEPIRKQLVPDDDVQVVLGFLELKTFSITLYDSNRNDNTVFGIGWGGSAKANDSNNLRRRDGFIIQLDSANGLEVGIGEVSPLSGLHAESRKQAQDQLFLLKDWLDKVAFDDRLTFSPRKMLSLDGAIQDLVTEIEASAGAGKLLPSVRGGLEMCLLALSSQKIGQPLHKALMLEYVKEKKVSQSEKFLVSGLITRSSSARRLSMTSDLPSRKFPSVKVKVGHQDTREDVTAMLRGFQGSQLYQGRSAGYVRADANRAWNESQTIEFALTLEGIDVNAMERIEFIEEPLQRVANERGGWSLTEQVEALEKTFLRSGIPYALDESIAEVVAYHNSNYSLIEEELSSIFMKGPRGCVAFILKPALIGFELSNRVARLARTKLGIGAVYSSCFDSGVGLAYTAFLANVANQMPSSTVTFPHGIGTFTMLESDTMTPAFDSFVNQNGILNIPTLSRALYGLSLDEIRDSTESGFVPSQPVYSKTTTQSPKTSYEASTATSNSGKEISVVVSLSLPFSTEIACSRFTDLPSMSRWSPWISSVQYQGTETEWTINIRGIPLKWRAESRIVSDPYPGIEWQSVSGLSNRGIVEFIPVTADSCTMTVRMTIVTPRLLKPLFQGTSIFVEEFLRDKLLKWSLEMFRDVVKADLAIERGDVELGDALIGAVEGKASAIEATLNSTTL